MRRFTLNYSERKRMWFVLDKDHDDIVFTSTDELTARHYAVLCNDECKLCG